MPGTAFSVCGNIECSLVAAIFRLGIRRRTQMGVAAPLTETSQAMIREKKHRLSLDSYAGTITVAFTLCVDHRAALFLDSSVVKEFEHLLLAEATRFDCDIPIYLFMPDHLHLLVQGRSQAAMPLNMIRMFKQKSGYRLSKNRPHHE